MRKRRLGLEEAGGAAAAHDSPAYDLILFSYGTDTFSAGTADTYTCSIDMDTFTAHGTGISDDKDTFLCADSFSDDAAGSTFSRDIHRLYRRYCENRRNHDLLRRFCWTWRLRAPVRP